LALPVGIVRNFDPCCLVNTTGVEPLLQVTSSSTRALLQRTTAGFAKKESSNLALFRNNLMEAGSNLGCTVADLATRTDSAPPVLSEGRQEGRECTTLTRKHDVAASSAAASKCTKHRSSNGKSSGKFRRPRQHVNPLSSLYQQPVQLDPGWATVCFEKVDRPLHVDIGCGYGTFCMEMARKHPDWNFLGLEIRQRVADHASKKRAQSGLRNVHFISSNANVDLDRILSDVTNVSSLHRVTIQFPDPCFKRKHWKRRVVQPSLVEVIAKYLVEGKGEVFLQSDIKKAAEYMRGAFRESAHFSDSQQSLDEWMHDRNPLEIPTEREIGRIQNGEPVYRAVFHRTNSSSSSSSSSDSSSSSSSHSDSRNGNNDDVVVVPST